MDVWFFGDFVISPPAGAGNDGARRYKLSTVAGFLPPRNSRDMSRSNRQIVGLIGTMLIVIGMLGLGLDAYWAPIAVRFLSDSAIGDSLLAVIPLLPIMLMVLGGYLVFLSKPRPARPPDNDIENRRP